MLEIGYENNVIPLPDKSLFSYIIKSEFIANSAPELMQNTFPGYSFILYWEVKIEPSLIKNLILYERGKKYNLVSIVVTVTSKYK